MSISTCNCPWSEEGLMQAVMCICSITNHAHINDCKHLPYQIYGICDTYIFISERLLILWDQQYVIHPLGKIVVKTRQHNKAFQKLTCKRGKKVCASTSKGNLVSIVDYYRLLNISRTHSKNVLIFHKVKLRTQTYNL